MMKQNYEKQKIAIRYWLLGRGWTNAVKAMDFAEKLHTGFRKDGQPEFSHQVSQANYARTLVDNMIYPEETICVVFLHDTVEDYGVSAQELEDLFGTRVATATLFMSKVINGRKLPNDVYYNNLESCAIASLAKGFDRVHNLMTMVGGFNPEKQRKYLKETDEYTVTMLKQARRKFTKQEPIYENIKFVMTNQVILYNEMLDSKNHTFSQ